MMSKSLFTGFHHNSCDPCSSKMGFFSRLKAKLCHSHSCDSYSAPSSTGCHTGPAMTAPSSPATPPKEMPAPLKEQVKPKTTQAPDNLRIPELGGTAGKY